MPDIVAKLPDETQPEAHDRTQTFYEQGENAGSPAPGSLKVGWTLRDSRNRVLDAMAFLINPQGLTRTHGSRSQLHATKGAFYVDNFGPAPTAIQLRQLVAEGKDRGDSTFYTAREDVQRWLTTIYLPAIDDRGPVKHVYFHDHHLERGFEERVYFPPQSNVVQRAVDLHGLWALDVSMVSLEKRPYAELEVTAVAKKGRRYIVKRGDTFTKITTALAGRGASSAKRASVHNALLRLNPGIRTPRRKPDGTYAKPLQLYPGEVIRLPATGQV